MKNGFCAGIPNLEEADASTITEYFQTYLQQVVTLHTAIFRKLLFESEGVPLDLAELFEDAGNTYLDLAEDIVQHHAHRRLLKIEEQLDADIEAALGRV